jgi:uncharacterized protein (UPF0261 family)
MNMGNILVVGTFDTKPDELNFIKEHIAATGVAIKTIDLSATGSGSGADVSSQEIAACHPEGVEAVFTGDRGTAVAGMGRGI